MINLIKNIWTAPASTIAAAIMLAIAVVVGADLDWPKEAIVGLSALSAFLSAFSGPNKPGHQPRLPLVLFGCVVLCLMLSSCTIKVNPDGSREYGFNPPPEIFFEK